MILHSLRIQSPAEKPARGQPIKTSKASQRMAKIGFPLPIVALELFSFVLSSYVGFCGETSSSSKKKVAVAAFGFCELL